MMFDRVVWFITPASQRTKENLWISARQITVTAVILECISIGAIFVGVMLLAFANSDFYDVVDRTRGGYGLLMSGLALQLAGRLYMFAGTYRTTQSSRGWIVISARKWETKTVLNAINTSGFALTVRKPYWHHWPS